MRKAVKKRGRPKSTTRNKKLMTYVPISTYYKLKQEANREEHTVSKMIKILIEAALARGY